MNEIGNEIINHTFAKIYDVAHAVMCLPADPCSGFITVYEERHTRRQRSQILERDCAISNI